MERNVHTNSTHFQPKLGKCLTGPNEKLNNSTYRVAQQLNEEKNLMTFQTYRTEVRPILRNGSCTQHTYWTMFKSYSTHCPDIKVEARSPGVRRQEVHEGKEPCLHLEKPVYILMLAVANTYYNPEKEHKDALHEVMCSLTSGI